jgi:hypothetical protein
LLALELIPAPVTLIGFCAETNEAGEWAELPSSAPTGLVSYAKMGHINWLLASLVPTIFRADRSLWAEIVVSVWSAAA